MSDSLYDRWYRLREATLAIFRRGKFTADERKTLLEDFAEFCYADKSCVVVAKSGVIDTHASAVAEGRREAYLRLQSILSLTDEQLSRMKELENE